MTRLIFCVNRMKVVFYNIEYLFIIKSTTFKVIFWSIKKINIGLYFFILSNGFKNIIK